MPRSKTDNENTEAYYNLDLVLDIGKGEFFFSSTTQNIERIKVSCGVSCEFW